MSNIFLKYYEANGISPVRQDVSDFARHVNRRAALYRQIGLPPLAFHDAEVLEVGPGGGYNAIVTAGFAPRRYVLIEPNSTGRNELADMFATHGVTRAEIRPCRLEEDAAGDLFDIVLCENLIPGLNNKEAFLSILATRVRPGGFLVITCQDRLSMFFESIRRYVAVEMVAATPEFKEQIACLSSVFSHHTKTLAGMTRPVDDWVMDNLIAPPLFNIEDYFSVSDALNFLGRDYFFHHLAPAMLPDHRWYKQLPNEPLDYNRHYLDAFATLRHNLVEYRSVTGPREPQLNDSLDELCLSFAKLARAHWLTPQGSDRDAALGILQAVATNVATIPLARAACEDAIRLFASGPFTADGVAHGHPEFAGAFGRGVQYLSLAKAGSPA